MISQMTDQTPTDQSGELSRRSLIAGTASVALAGCGERSDTSQNDPVTRDTEETAEFPRGFATARDRHDIVEITLGYPDEGVLRDEFLAEVVAYNGLPTQDLEDLEGLRVGEAATLRNPDTAEITFFTLPSSNF